MEIYIGFVRREPKNDLARCYCDKFGARDRAEMKGRGREETCPALRSPDKSGKPRFSAFSRVRNLPDSSNEKNKTLLIHVPAPSHNISYVTPQLRNVFSGKQSILLKIDWTGCQTGRAMETIEIEQRWALR